jgi:AraC-like DNA-binding protein
MIVIWCVSNFRVTIGLILRRAVLLLLFFSVNDLFAIDQRVSRLVDLEELRGFGINIVSHGLWFIDESSTIPIEDIPTKAFKPYQELSADIPRGASLWAAFKLKPGERSQAELVFVTPTFTDYARLYTLAGQRWKVRESGLSVAHQKLPIPENFMALPFLSDANTDSIIYLQFNNQQRTKLAINELYVLNKTEEQFWRSSLYNDNKAKYQFYFVFIALIFFILVIFMIQWLAQRNTALLFYCLYLLTCALYYLRIFEGIQYDFRPIFKYAGGGQYHLEIMMAFCSYIFYLKFVSILLELELQRHNLEQFLHYVRVIFVVATPVLWLTGYVAGSIYMSDAYVYIRILFFITGLLMIFSLIRFHGEHPMTKFITSGTIFLILGMIMTLSPEILGGQLEKNIGGGAFGWYIAKDNQFSFPIYDFKTGVLLEIIIFSAGLGFRERLQRAEYLTAIEKLARAAAEKQVKASAPLYPFSMQSDFIKLAVRVCEAHIEDDEFNVEQLAQKMQLSRRALYSKTNEFIDIDPSIFIRTIRLYQAKQLLDGLENMPIAEIAYKVGFKHPYYFTRVFRQEFGCTPSDYLSKKNGTSPEY